MERFKNGKLILLIAVIGLLAVIAAVLCDYFTYAALPRGYTPQEIEELGIGRIDINTASAEELGELHDLSPKQIQSIIAYRSEHGGFRSVEELTYVDGIGRNTFERIAPYMTVE